MVLAEASERKSGEAGPPGGTTGLPMGSQRADEDQCIITNKSRHGNSEMEGAMLLASRNYRVGGRASDYLSRLWSRGSDPPPGRAKSGPKPGQAQSAC
ncbi:hypothetical protein MJO28_010344 [Puccinia striiformis f. sp. tritici]|uniref:Uncharacterized protein n=1 Tax=Puccinia striiformis f. sp. tritici TaxID=168172 RepID=A0ACC0E5U9_9BASI|nr:hypothetical protein MJO28_010344 [Puccinia striiformis f. sp. tritici]